MSDIPAVIHIGSSDGHNSGAVDRRPNRRSGLSASASSGGAFMVGAVIVLVVQLILAASALDAKRVTNAALSRVHKTFSDQAALDARRPSAGRRGGADGGTMMDLLARAQEDAAGDGSNDASRDVAGGRRASRRFPLSLGSAATAAYMSSHARAMHVLDLDAQDLSTNRPRPSASGSSTSDVAARVEPAAVAVQPTVATVGTSPSNQQRRAREERGTLDVSSTNTMHLRNIGGRTAVLVLAYNRAALLRHTVRSVLRARGSRDLDVVISIDGGRDAATVAAARELARRHPGRVQVLIHPRPTLTVQRPQTEGGEHVEAPGTAYLAAHYKWALDQVLLETDAGGNPPVSSPSESSLGRKRQYEFVAVIEDDMHCAADMFEFFDAFAPALERTPSSSAMSSGESSSSKVWCLSAWNDHAFAPFDLPADAAYRTSYFPGLGWLMHRSLWVADLRARWPRDNWDHWMRVSTTHRGRACIAPFRARNFNLGDEGGATATSEFYERYLRRIVSTVSPQEISALQVAGDAGDGGEGNPNDDTTKAANVFSSEAVQTLRSEAAYDAALAQRIASTRRVDITQVSLAPQPPGSGGYRVLYKSEEFGRISQMLNLHSFPRTHYKHVTWLRLPIQGSHNSNDGVHLFLIDARMSPFAREASPGDGSEGLQSERILPSPTLTVVPAQSAGVSCTDVCAAHRPADEAEERQRREAELAHAKVVAARAPLQHQMAAVGNSEAVQAALQRHAVVPGTDGRDGDGGPGTNWGQVIANLNQRLSHLGRPMRCDASQFDFINDCVVLARHFRCPGGCTQGWGEDIPNEEALGINHDPQCLVTEMAPTCEAAHPLTTRLCPCVHV